MRHKLILKLKTSKDNPKIFIKILGLSLDKSIFGMYNRNVLLNVVLYKNSANALSLYLSHWELILCVILNLLYHILSLPFPLGIDTKGQTNEKVFRHLPLPFPLGIDTHP